MHVDGGAAAVLGQLHARPEVLRRRDDAGPDVGLLDSLDEVRIGHLGRAVDVDPLVAAHAYVVFNVRGGGEQFEAVLALQPFAHDVHVQQAEEPAAETEAERLRGLRLVRQCGVVEGELLERVAQIAVAVRVKRIEPAEHHGPDLPITR